MATETKCLPACRCECGDRNDHHGVMGDQFDPSKNPADHATGCPRAPKSPEAPKVERQRACRCVAGFDGYCPQHGSSAPFLDPREQPAPAPEPKQGSEDGRCLCGRWNGTVSALRAEVERLKQELEYVMADGLEKSAQLAEKEREIAEHKYSEKAAYEAVCDQVATERAARERAEELHELHCANPTCLGPRS